MSPPHDHSPRRLVQRLAGEIAAFGAVGILGVVVNLGLFAALDGPLPAGRANALSTTVSIITNYIGYRYWVYRDTDPQTRSREITLFLIFSWIGAGIQVGMVYAATYWLELDTHLDKLAAAVVGIGVATIFRFWTYRTCVFPSGREASAR